MEKRKYFLIVSLIFIAFIIAFNFVPGKKKELPYLGEVGHSIAPFSFLDQDSTYVTSRTVKGKIKIVEFFFTTCRSICPKMNSNLKTVYKEIKNSPNVIILSHTVDPDVDKVSVLKKYALKLGVNSPQWRFLTGEKLELYNMARYSYLLSVEEVSADNIADAFIHKPYVVLIDRNDKIRGFYNATELGALKKLINDANSLDDFDIKKL